MTAVDLDTGNNARLSYRLQGSTAFLISPNTGWIYLAQSLDRESVDRLALTVLATDNGSPAATASASVLVTVLDDNDNDPRFERDFYGFELLENLPAGTIVGSVSATDPDLGKNSLLRYSVIQANSSFTVDPDTGEARGIFNSLPYFSGSILVRSRRCEVTERAYASLRRNDLCSSVCESRQIRDRGEFEDRTERRARNSNAEKNIGGPFP